MARRVSKKKTNENKEMNDIMEIYKNGFSVEDRPTKNGGDIIIVKPLEKKKNKKRD